MGVRNGCGMEGGRRTREANPDCRGVDLRPFLIFSCPAELGDWLRVDRETEHCASRDEGTPPSAPESRDRPAPAGAVAGARLFLNGESAMGSGERNGGFRRGLPICRRAHVIKLDGDQKYYDDKQAECDEADKNLFAEGWLSRFCEQRHRSGSPVIKNGCKPALPGPAAWEQAAALLVTE